MLIQGSESLGESHVLMHLWNAKQDAACTELELKDIEFDPTLVSSFIDILPTTSWTDLTLTNCHGGSIVNDVIWAICASTNTPIQTFKLHQSMSTVDSMTFAAIAFGLKYAKNWRSLSLAVRTIDYDASNVLARALARNTWLCSLNLGGSVISPAAIGSLSFGLRLNQSLKSLVLDGCALEDDQIAVILQALQDHTSLRSLSIQQNACHDQGMGAIAALLHYNNLEELDMSYLIRKKKQPVPHPAEEQQTSAEEESKSDDQQVDESGGNADDSKEEGDAPESSRKEEEPATHPDSVNMNEQQDSQDIEAHEVTDDADSQKVRNLTLKNFQLAGNYLSDTFVESVLGIFGTGSALEELNLFGNRISDYGLRLILQKIPKLHRLKTLWLAHNLFSAECAKEFIPVMKLNYTLQEVSIRSFDGNEMESIQSTIDYYCRLNRGGRRIFASDSGTIPLALWPLIMERAHHVFWGASTSNISTGTNHMHAADVLYSLLHGPALFENPNVILS